MQYRVWPATDDRPFFNFLRKGVGPVEADPDRFADLATSLVMNSQLRGGVVPMDTIHLVVTAMVSLGFVSLVVVLPLYWSEVGQSAGKWKYVSMVYFSCLGAGFILLELVFIQIFMKFIGYPAYTYVLVIFTVLLGAGVGSLSSARMRITPTSRWTWPFWGLLGYGFAFCVAYPILLDRWLAAPDVVRMGLSVALIGPFGFFLGMPFPLGVLAIERQPPGAIGWAWGMNGLFTVVGSLDQRRARASPSGFRLRSWSGCVSTSARLPPSRVSVTLHVSQ